LINGPLAQNRYGLHTNVSGTLGDILKLARKNGTNRILDEVTPRGQARVRPMDKLDEACTNADDRMMLVRYRSGDRVMS